MTKITKDTTQRLRLASANGFKSVIKSASSDYLNFEIPDSTTPAVALDDSAVESNTINEVYAGFH